MSEQSELDHHVVKAKLSKDLLIESCQSNVSVTIDRDGQILIGEVLFLWPAEFALILEHGPDVLKRAEVIEANYVAARNSEAGAE